MPYTTGDHNQNWNMGDADLDFHQQQQSAGGRPGRFSSLETNYNYNHAGANDSRCFSVDGDPTPDADVCGQAVASDTTASDQQLGAGTQRAGDDDGDHGNDCMVTVSAMIGSSSGLKRGREEEEEEEAEEELPHSPHDDSLMAPPNESNEKYPGEVDEERAALETVGPEGAKPSPEVEGRIEEIRAKMNSFTETVSGMLEAGKSYFNDAAAAFEDRIVQLHQHHMQKWEEEINQLLQIDEINEDISLRLANAQSIYSSFGLSQRCSED
ncbi:hypothetical protein CBR_g39249 [Chara braunii]|uniref:Uncharacterized protein n=1 Tax=Chara braunii TaxID=69332 RepID=A0A388K103_CHABU|nr:hypothetical protein CBR_g39249 [Chara braunii]|eukprot:GBG63707.1 hypothetical protein CBR_g39249 [Chara braunii]